MTGFRPRLWPTVFTIPAVLILLSLGTWQVQRLYWKEGLIAQRQAGLAAPIAPWAEAAGNPGAFLWHRVSARGRFLHDRELVLAARSMNGNPGYHIVTPFESAAGPALLVDRGWVPLDRKAPAARTDGQVAGEVTVGGILRPGHRPSWLTPDNEPETNFWFWVDLPAMARAAGLAGSAIADVYLEADATPNPGGSRSAARPAPSCPTTTSNTRSPGTPSRWRWSSSMCSIIAARPDARREPWRKGKPANERLSQPRGPLPPHRRHRRGVLDAVVGSGGDDAGGRGRDARRAARRAEADPPRAAYSTRRSEELLGTAEAEPLDEWQRANLAEMRRRWLNATALAPRLVEAWSRATSDGEMAWRTARPESRLRLGPAGAGEDRPAGARDRRCQGRGARPRPRTTRCTTDTSRAGAPPISIRSSRGSSASCRRCWPPCWNGSPACAKPIAPLGPFPADRQKALGLALMTAAGFDFEHGRLDETPHPFCGGVAGGPAHHHALRRGELRRGPDGRDARDRPRRFTSRAARRLAPPAGRRGRAAMSIHESQSLLIEMQACRSRAFIDYLGAAPAASASAATRPGLRRGQPLPHLYLGRAGLHPRRCRRGHLSRARHPALRASSRRWSRGDLAVADLPRRLERRVPGADRASR